MYWPVSRLPVEFSSEVEPPGVGEHPEGVFPAEEFVRQPGVVPRVQVHSRYLYHLRNNKRQIIVRTILTVR